MSVDAVTVGLAAFGCGVVNTVAGGGSLILFPALLATGMGSLAANVTVGGLMAEHEVPFGVYDGFPVLSGARSEAGYDFTEVDWTATPVPRFSPVA